MSFLPRSRRGTWLLAAAVWLAACAVLWWALPIVPRAVMTLPDGTRLLGFSPDCTKIVVDRYILNPISDTGGKPFALEMRDFPNGRLLASLKEPSGSFTVLETSRDGRFWLMSETVKPSPTRHWLNLETNALHEIPTSTHEWQQPALSPDGRFGFFPPVEGRFAEVWDFRQMKRLGAVPEGGWAATFSTDGRFIAMTTSGDANHIRIIEPGTWKKKSEIVGPPNTTVSRLSLNEDGTLLMGVATAMTDNPPDWLCCWDVTTGKELLKSSWGKGRLVGKDLVLVAGLNNNPSLHCCDMTNGGMRFDMQHVFRNWQVSPDSRRFFVHNSWTQFGFVRAFFSRWNISWPFREDRGHVDIHEVEFGKLLCTIPLRERALSPSTFYRLEDISWLPDSKGIVICEADSPKTWQIWDIPPRKSLPWFGAGAAMFALPLAIFARRRVRRLRAA